MHIWNNLKDFLYDKNNFIAIYNDNIYIYNFNKLITLNPSTVVLLIDNRKVKITGDKLKVLKCSNEEIIIKGFVKGINYCE